MPSGVAAGAPERRGSTSSEGSAAGSTHTRSVSILNMLLIYLLRLCAPGNSS